MISKRKFDLIVFDWDGTLFDSTALITRSIQLACSDLGVPVPSDRDASYVIGLGLMEALAYVAPALAASRYEELCVRYRHHYVHRQHEVTLFDGTVPMLQGLKARQHYLAVATGKSRGGLNEALSVSGLAVVFDATRTADETCSKPSPLMLHELMCELGVPPERTLMIGDTTHDLQMALNASTASVGVSYGAHAHDTFADFSPLTVVHTVSDLDTWLIQHA